MLFWTMAYTILVGEDNPVQRQLANNLLTKKLGYRVLEAKDGRETLKQIEQSNIDEISAVLLDVQMPGMDGFETLKAIRRYRPDLPVVMLTGQNDTATAVKAIKAGASDFIVKPPDPAQLDVALRNAIRLSTLSRELMRVKRDKEGALSFTDLVGFDSGLSEAVAYGRRAAASDVPVLITGETSTGKELIARAIHGESRRVGAPFVAINCSAIPADALESLLFGHEKGTLPGAIKNVGKFREAERGTVFLDDIHVLPADAQVKLLRVLQQQEVEPVGTSKPVKVNIRMITATDRSLKAEVNAGRFREDLYFRLNVLTIVMPPLRERSQDILPLVEYFMQRIASMEALTMKPLSANARQYLSDYVWPGNVRELESLIHRALVLCEDEMIDCNLLIRIHDQDTVAKATASFSEGELNIRQPNGHFKTMEHIELEVMKLALEHYEHNITRASEALGIAKSTFYRKIKGAG